MGVSNTFGKWENLYTGDDGEPLYIDGVIFDVTITKEYELEIKDANKKWEDTFNAIEDGICLLDSEGTLLQCNAEMETLLERPSKEFIGKKCWEVMHGKYEPIDNCPVVKMWESKKRETSELQIDDQWFKITADPILGENGSLTNAVHILHNITKRKRMENARDELLKESEKVQNDLSVLIENIVDEVWFCDKNGDIILANAAARKFEQNAKPKNEKSLDGLIKSVKVFDLDGSPRPKESSPLLRSLNGEILTHLDEIVIFPGSDDKYYRQVSSAPIKNKKGEITGAVAVVRDITRHKKYEKEIVKAKNDWENTFNAVPDLIAVLDTDYKIIRCNKSMASALGLEPKQCVGLTCHRVFHGLDKPPSFCPHSKLLKDGLEHEVEIYEDLLGADFNITVSPLHNQTEELTGCVHVARDVTQSKKAEEKIRDQYHTLEGIINSNESPIFSVDRQYQYTSFNKSHAAVMKALYDADIEIGRSILEYQTVLEDKITAKDNIDRALKGERIREEAYSGEERLSRLYFDVLHNPIQDEEGIVIGAAIYAQDITERKNAEKTLQKSEERYRALFESNPNYTILLNLDGDILDVNAAAKGVIGRSKENLVGKNFTELGIFPEEDRILHEETFMSLLDGEYIPPHESKFIDSNGEIRWEEIVLTTIKKDGVPTSVLVISSDITERKQYEKKITISENRYRMIGQLISDFAYSCVHGEHDVYEVDWITDSFYHLTGFTEKELNSHRCWLFTVHPQDEQIAQSQLAGLKAGSKNVRDFRILSSNGETRWLRNHVECVEDKDLGKLRIYGAAEDITNLKRALKDLEQSEERFRALINNSTDLIRILDKNGHIIFDSPSSARILGYPEGSLIGKSPLEFIHPDDLERVTNDLTEVYENQNPGIPTEFRIRKADGEYLPVESVSQNMNNVPAIGGILVTTHPIKERKAMEDEIKASLKEKEVLLKEIHHRVKNNMQIISSLLNLQIQHVFGDNIAIDVLTESQNRVKSMAMIHEKLYQSQNLTDIRFDDYIQRLVSDLFYSYNILKDQIKLVLEVEEVELNMETAIPCGLIISEIVSNSLKHAFPQRRKGEVRLSLKLHNNGYELIIGDNGVGLPDDLNFKNTDSLGLQLVNSLVGQIDGEIELDRSEGTEFIIKFKELKYKERL